MAANAGDSEAIMVGDTGVLKGAWREMWSYQGSPAAARQQLTKGDKEQTSPPHIWLHLHGEETGR